MSIKNPVRDILTILLPVIETCPMAIIDDFNKHLEQHFCPFQFKYETNMEFDRDCCPDSVTLIDNSK